MSFLFRDEIVILPLGQRDPGQMSIEASLLPPAAFATVAPLSRALIVPHIHPFLHLNLAVSIRPVLASVFSTILLPGRQRLRW